MQYVQKVIFGLLLIGILIGISGCAVFKSSKNKNAKQEESARAKVESVDSLIGANLQDKFTEVANISYGVDYALSKETDPSKPVQVAKNLNERAMSITGQPSIADINKMKKLIDDLTSQLQTERTRGMEALALKDKEIYQLQLEASSLELTKDLEIKKYMKIAADTAAQADAIQSELDKMNNFMGMGAIWYGVKRLVTRLAWILGIGGILFIGLRFASMSNPVAASIFSIFNMIGSWLVNIIKVIVPKAVEMAGNTANSVFNAYRSTLFKVVDAIEITRDRASAADRPTDIGSVLDEASKTMNGDEKAIVEEIKKTLNWK